MMIKLPFLELLIQFFRSILLLLIVIHGLFINDFFGITESTNTYPVLLQGAQLRKHIDATLGSGNLREAVKLPTGEDLNEWLAVNSNSLSLSLSLSCVCGHTFSEYVACLMYVSFSLHLMPVNLLGLVLSCATLLYWLICVVFFT